MAQTFRLKQAAPSTEKDHSITHTASSQSSDTITRVVWSSSENEANPSSIWKPFHLVHLTKIWLKPLRAAEILLISLKVCITDAAIGNKLACMLLSRHTLILKGYRVVILCNESNWHRLKIQQWTLVQFIDNMKFWYLTFNSECNRERASHNENTLVQNNTMSRETTLKLANHQRWSKCISNWPEEIFKTYKRRLWVTKTKTEFFL